MNISTLMKTIRLSLAAVTVCFAGCAGMENPFEPGNQDMTPLKGAGEIANDVRGVPLLGSNLKELEDLANDGMKHGEYRILRFSFDKQVVPMKRKGKRNRTL